MLIKMLQPRPGKAVDDALFKNGGSYFNFDQMMMGQHPLLPVFLSTAMFSNININTYRQGSRPA